MSRTDYIDRCMAIKALKKMKSFHDDLECTMRKHGLDLRANSGRRNILLSQAQEAYFAEALSSDHEVTTSGRTGEPDIIIHSLGRELECKLTSPHVNGAINFQTDFETLSRKQSVDYLYVVTDADFERFAVFHCTDLTVEDFRPMANGSRGKVQMQKHKVVDRMRPLVGGLDCINEKTRQKLVDRLPRARNEKSRAKIEAKIQESLKQTNKYKIIMESINEI